MHFVCVPLWLAAPGPHCLSGHPVPGRIGTERREQHVGAPAMHLGRRPPRRKLCGELPGIRPRGVLPRTRGQLVCQRRTASICRVSHPQIGVSDPSLKFRLSTAPTLARPIYAWASFAPRASRTSLTPLFTAHCPTC